jgi:hypothetical protein
MRATKDYCGAPTIPSPYTQQTWCKQSPRCFSHREWHAAQRAAMAEFAADGAHYARLGAYLATPPNEEAHDAGYLYCVEGTLSGFRKFGMSRTPNVDQRTRLISLQVACGEPLRVRALVDTWRVGDKERLIHGFLAGDRAWGEWYNPTEVVDRVASLLRSMSGAARMQQAELIMAGTRDPKSVHYIRGARLSRGHQAILAGGA